MMNSTTKLTRTVGDKVEMLEISSSGLNVSQVHTFSSPADATRFYFQSVQDKFKEGFEVAPTDDVKVEVSASKKRVIPPVAPVAEKKVKTESAPASVAPPSESDIAVYLTCQ